MRASLPGCYLVNDFLENEIELKEHLVALSGVALPFFAAALLVPSS